MRIGIVGGSIAGCTAAILLTRAGHEVVVVERSRGGLKGRGAGIGTPSSTLDDMVERRLIGPQTPRFMASSYPMASRATPEDRYGHIALVLPLDMALLNWGDLWNQLRARVPESSYMGGREIVRVTEGEGHVILEGDGGWGAEFDLVLFADGYRSMGRAHLFPKLELSYRGYVLWRGVLDEARLADSSPLESRLYRFHYKGLPGNAVFYFVPGEGGSVEQGRRWVNWACYVPLDESGLEDFLVDRDGRRHQHSIPPGLMREDEEARLGALMASHLPGYFAEVIAASQGTFAQPIFSVTTPAYARGRIGLLGDAGSVAPPFTGSGVFKAVGNAIDLVDALEREASVEEALARWSADQTARGQRLAALGRQMEDAFVWSAPDFSTMDEAAARDWWTEAVTFPEEFRYVGEEE